MIRLFKVFIPTSVLALLVSETILIFSCYIAATIYLFGGTTDLELFLFDDHGLARITVVAVLIIAGLYFHDLYTNYRILSNLVLLQQLCLILGIAFVSQALISYANRLWILPKWLMIEGSMLTLIVLFFWRLLFSSAIWKAVGTQKVLFLGSSPSVFQVASHLADHPEFGFLAVGYLAESESTELHTKVDKLGYISDLMGVVGASRPQRIVVGLGERRQKLPVHDLLELRFSGIQTEEISSLYETTFGRVCTREIRPSHLIFSGELGPRPYSVRLQKIYSTALALVGVVITLPIMAIVALLIRVTSPGPILFRQTRVGLHDKPFTVFKFRSMRQDAEARTGAVWATRNDPRITSLGRWLRKLRLDELPQLFNVLRGDMSIVGPRPERPEFVKVLSEQIPYYRQRHCVMPGITGWAQINYKYGDTIEDTITKLEYDLYYIKHISLSLDLYIMFHTAKTMLLSRGAQ